MAGARVLRSYISHTNKKNIFRREMEYQQIMWLITLAFAAAGLFPLVYNLRHCYRAILNDARIISRDPALQSNFEILYAYPGGCRVSREREREFACGVERGHVVSWRGDLVCLFLSLIIRVEQAEETRPDFRYFVAEQCREFFFLSSRRS